MKGRTGPYWDRRTVPVSHPRGREVGQKNRPRVPQKWDKRTVPVSQKGGVYLGQIIHGSLCPHPPIAVPEVGNEDSARVKGTQRAIREVGKNLAKLKPDVLIAISPHAPVFPDGIAVDQIPILRGSLRQFGAGNVEFELENDLEMGKAIVAAAREKEVAVEVLDASILRENRVTEVLDHGLMVPLYFFREAGLDCPIVPISISFMPLEQMYVFGAAMASAVQQTGKKAAVLASGDLSHRLIATAPAGYHPDGKIFDETIQKAVRNMDPMVLLELSDELIERAGQCGLRPLLMLMGAFDGYAVRSVIHSYEGPFGVGYLTAEFIPKESRARRKYLERILADRGSLSYPVRLAMRSLKAFVTEGKRIPVPDDVPEEFLKPAGAFVSLKKHGELRGCIGTLGPTKGSAAEEIIANAISAATADPRFDPVRPEEIDHLQCSVDILGEPEKVKSLEDLDPKRYGVIVRRGGRCGVLLPDLEGVDTVVEQVGIAKRKAGISPFEDCEIERFEVIRYT